jgi:hypothetical protein
VITDSGAGSHPSADLAALLADGDIVGNESDDVLSSRHLPFLGSAILNPAQQQKINEWIGRPTQRWEVCYRRSEHGFANTNAFFSRCKHRGPSVTVIRTGNRTLGGYTENSWTDGNYGYRGYDDAFVFSLDRMERYFPTYDMDKTTYHHTNGFVRFGAGHDVNVQADGNLSCNFGYTYGSACNNYAYRNPTNACSQELCGGNNGQAIAIVEMEVWVQPRN